MNYKAKTGVVFVILFFDNALKTFAQEAIETGEGTVQVQGLISYWFSA